MKFVVFIYSTLLLDNANNRKNTIKVADGIDFYLPFNEQPLNDQEQLAVRLLTGIDKETVPTATRIKKSQEVFHSELYQRRGNTCSSIVEVQSRISIFGKVLKFVLVDTRPVAIIQLFHKHDLNICKDGHDQPSIPLLRQLVRDKVLAPVYYPVEMIAEILAVNCSSISRKCIFVGDTDFASNVCGFLVPDLRDYRV